MSESFAKVGIDLLIISASAEDELIAYKRAIAGRRVDAFVVPRTRIDDDRLALLHSHAMPFVAYGRCAKFGHPYAWFDFDNVAGARAGAERLIGFGHRRIGYLGAPPIYNFAAQRFEGFRKALHDAGLALDAATVRRNALDRRSGYAAMEQMLALAQPPTAVFIDNHLAGVGATHAALHAGCVLGRDLSLIVYDGLGTDSMIRSRITSIDQPTTDLTGATLADMVLERLKGRAPEGLQCLRMPALLAGDSDGAPISIAPTAPSRRDLRRAAHANPARTPKSR